MKKNKKKRVKRKGQPQEYMPGQLEDMLEVATW